MEQLKFDFMQTLHMKLTSLHSEISKTPTLSGLLIPEPDPWDNTPYKGYVYVNNHVKGKYGELFVEILMKDLGHAVNEAKTRTSGHDRVINNTLTEIKFALAARDTNDKGLTRTDVFLFNHFSVNKDWERAILVGVNIDCRPYVYWFDKADFVNEVSKSNSASNYFKRQQAGQHGGNDDWLFFTTPDSWEAFANESWVKSIYQW
jgi:hypothetical protein